MSNPITIPFATEPVLLAENPLYELALHTGPPVRVAGLAAVATALVDHDIRSVNWVRAVGVHEFTVVGRLQRRAGFWKLRLSHGQLTPTWVPTAEFSAVIRAVADLLAPSLVCCEPVIDLRTSRWVLPRNQHFPSGTVQCDECGGHGCTLCSEYGWYAWQAHPLGRRCENEECNRPIRPDCVAVYCSNNCAMDDA